jgi:hypothetical protein
LKHLFSCKAKHVCRAATLSLVAAFLFGAGLAPVEAGSLREKRLQQGENEALADEARFTSEVCGTRISASIDWDSYTLRDGRLSGRYARDCDRALSAIERICRQEGGKRKVRRQIKSVRCGAGDRRRIVLKEGRLLYAISDRRGADYEYIYDYLSKNL